jgi:hypothetical protein
MSQYHPYVLWRRAALWSNSSVGARVVFWGGCLAAAWAAGEYTMQLTNKRTHDPALKQGLESKMSVEQRAQTAVAQQQLQRLLNDVKDGRDQKADWRPR